MRKRYDLLHSRTIYKYYHRGIEQTLEREESTSAVSGSGERRHEGSSMRRLRRLLPALARSLSFALLCFFLVFCFFLSPSAHTGGQKARVAIARAIFASCDTLLLDDPLSAVDAHVGHFLFHSCIREYLAGRTRLLVTHQLQYVRHADRVIVMEGGKIREQGTYEELMKNTQGKFAKLMEEFGGKHEDQHEETEGEEKESDRASAEVKRLAPRAGSSAAAAASTPAPSALSSADAGALEKLMQVEERVKGGVALDVYFYYLRAGGGFWPCFGFFFFMILANGVSSYNSWWLSDWTDDSFGLSQSEYVVIYSVISVAGMFLTAMMMLFCAHISVQASTVLHQRSFQRVIRAPTAFFDTTRQFTHRSSSSVLV